MTTCGRIGLTTLLMNFALVFSGYSQFVTIWKTDNPGTSKNNQVRLPITGNYTLTYEQIDDPTNTRTLNLNTSGAVIIEFRKVGTYKISITGDLRQIRFAGKNDKDKLLSIEQWGNIQWKSMIVAFQGCSNMEYNATDVPDLSQITSLQGMFRDCPKFNGNINNWDVSNVTNMYEIFRNATSFNQPLDKWDMSNVTNTGTMFWGASSFNQPVDSWNLGNVTDARLMFAGASAFNQSVKSWNTAKMSVLNSMFASAAAFNQDLSAWDVTGATSMAGMLSGSGLSLGNYDRTLTSWASQNVKSGVRFNASGLKYCAAEASRNKLVNDKKWDMADDAKDCPAKDIEVQLDGVEVSSGSSTIDFGAGTTIEKTFTIYNIGTTNALSLSGSPIVAITEGTAFAISEQPSAANIAAGGSLTFKVKYTAATADDKGTLSIASDDPDEAKFTLKLTGILKKIDQAITFDLGNDANKTANAAAFDLAATGGASGNAVTFTSSDPSVATISGNTVTIVGIGTTTITASQAGSSHYNAAPDITQTLTVQSTVTAVSASKFISIHVFPNPVSHMLRIKLNGKQLHDYAEIRVLNHQGKRVLLMGQRMKNGEVEIPVQKLKAGSYLLQMTVGEETFVHRFIKP